MKPGPPALPRPGSSAALLCNRNALLFKILQSVKLPVAHRAPRPAWAAGSVALHPGLHKKGSKPRRREGDKCFSRILLLSLAVSIA